MQWGTKTGASNKTITISLNITFTTTSYIPYAVDKTYGQSTSHVGLSARANNAFTINHSTDGDTVYWSAIGYQQWGYNNTSSAATIYFPIAFPSACYSVVLGGYRQCTGNQRATSITKTSFYLGGDSASDAQYSRWMAVGSQQWGVGASQGYYPAKTLTFPIAYSSAPYTVIANWKSGGAGEVIWNVMSAQSWSKTGFKCINSAGESAVASWFSLGIQQWGKSSSSGRATTTVTLPISMASAIYAVAISQAAASDTWSTWSSIVSNTQIKLTNNYGPGSWWLVIGKQQWGVTTYSGCGNCFPISFTAPYAVIAEEHHKTTTATNYDGSFMTTRLTTTGFSYRAESTGYADAIMFVAFGKQRSGERLTLHQILPLLLPFL